MKIEWNFIHSFFVYLFLYEIRSAEQLLAAEAAECRRKSGRRGDLGRAVGGAKGAWGQFLHNIL